MTMTGIELDNQLARLTSLYNYKKKGRHVVFINLYFTKWNSRFRQENTLATFSALDECFGTKYLFQNTHSVFENSLVLYQNRNNQYIRLDGHGGHRGHRGGFEGMRQKGWTLFTLCAILLHAHIHNYVITILGQGDNQVICLEVPSDKPDPEYVRTYLKSLSAFLATLGLPPKPEDLFIF